jgi:hypothetical protein
VLFATVGNYFVFDALGHWLNVLLGWLRVGCILMDY